MSNHTIAEKLWFVYSITLWLATLSFTIISAFIYLSASPIILISLVIATFGAYGTTIFSLKKMNISQKEAPVLIKIRDKILPIKIIFWCSIIYFPINFIIGMIFLWEGGPDIINGVYWLTDHGNLVREITEAEYIRLSRAEMRLMSGGLLTFIAIPIAHFSPKNIIIKEN